MRRYCTQTLAGYGVTCREGLSRYVAYSGVNHNRTRRAAQILHNLADNVGCSALAGLSTNHYDATIPMLIAQSPMNNTIETPTYNMASIMVFPFQLCERGALTFKKWPGFSRA
jgi:Na+/H+-translocating membrane pyrophosphatase